MVLADSEARATTSMHDTPNLNDLAKRRLAQLTETGLSSLASKSEDTVRLRLLDGREVHFRLGPEDWQYQYRGATRVPASERMERAILGTLVALEAGPIGPRRETEENSKVYRQAAHLRVGMQEAMREAADELEAAEKAIEADPVLKDAGADAWQGEARLSLAEALLRHYHPDFDDRPKAARIDLLIGAARHMDEALRGLEALQEYVQAGRVGGRARKKAADPHLDVRAAELRDALDLKPTEIGEILNIPRSDTDKNRGGHRTVVDMVKRGRNLLVANLGEEGYRKYLETVRTHLRRYRSLDDRERLLQRMIELRAALRDSPLEEVEAMRPAFERLVDEHFREG